MLINDKNNSMFKENIFEKVSTEKTTGHENSREICLIEADFDFVEEKEPVKIDHYKDYKGSDKLEMELVNIEKRGAMLETMGVI